MLMRIGSGAALVGVANLVSSASLFAVSVAVGRSAGATNLGRYGLLVVVGTFFGGIIDFGTDRILTERLAQRSAHWIAAWWAVVLFKGCAIVVAFVLGFAVLQMQHAVFALLIVAQGASVTATLTAQAMGAALHRLPALAITRGVGRAVAVAGVGWMIGTHVAPGSVVANSIVFVSVADLIGVAFLGVWVFRPELGRLDRQPWSQASVWTAVRAGLPLGISSLAIWLYLKLDTLILAAVSDLSTLGAYTGAVRIAELLGGIPAALNAVVLTAFADLWSQDARRFQLARDAVLAATTLGMGFVCMVLFLLAGPVVDATFHLAEVTVYVRPLVWGQVFAAAGVICSASLQVSKRSGAVAHIALLVALLSIPTYIFLISFFGAFGAAVGTTALYSAILPIGLLLPASRQTFLPLLADATALTLSLLAAFATLVIAQHGGPIPLGFQVAIASVAYIAVAACCLPFLIHRSRGSGARHPEDRPLP